MLVPHWVRQTLGRMANDLNGEHGDGAMVAVTALLGREGFSVASIEEAVTLDPQTFGMLMLEGYTICAGKSLAQVFSSTLAMLRHPEHPSNQEADPAARLNAKTEAFNLAFRQFLRRALEYAGREILAAERDRGGPVPAGGQVALSPDALAALHVLGVFIRVADSPIEIKTPKAANEAEEAGE